MEYSKTVNLPKTDFPMKAELPKKEPALLALWEKEKVYEKALERREGKPKFVLHDGPPYANGHLHLGHALNKILKDMIVRYKTMGGFYAPYVPGWDCHGLPIELQLMKELKVTDKHKVNREAFRDQARVFAQKFVDIQREEFKRMGVLGDWDHPYLTMAEPYKKTIVQTFEDLQKKGYVYRGKKPVYWCSTDETALAEAEIEYENKIDKAIYVAFPTVEPNVFYVIWTTTPWTLPANVAIAYNPKIEYVRFVMEGENPRQYIVAVERGDVLKKLLGIPMGRGVKQTTFPEAKHPWIKNRRVPVLAADFVTTDTGTGLVHIAPGHGAEDYKLGQQQKPPLPVLSPVDDRGLFTDEVPEWKGQHVFKANPLIIDFLKEKGLLLHAEEITHSYPHCWRCHRPLIFRATEQWFLSIDKEGLREKLLGELKKVTFYPEFGRNRITGMVETRPDWCLSRQRLWGTEIPEQPSEVRGPTSDVGRRTSEPDIFDVWFESGVSWAAVLKNTQEWPELTYPADLYLEGSDQHRGWFQVSLIPSVALENKAPFKSVLTHGFVMDGEGRPMSKSLGNVISPEEIIKQYGADILRFWVASSDYGGDVRLSPEILKGLSDSYRKVRNTFRYLLNNLGDFDPAKDSVGVNDFWEIDRWVLHRLQEEIRDALAAYESYQFHRVTSRLVNFCNADLSSFYLDVIKDRLYCDPVGSRSRRAAQTVLYRLSDALFRLLAPVLGFTTDECWRFAGHKESVSLSDLPVVDGSLTDAALAEDWTILLNLRSTVLSELEKARAAGKLKAPREAVARLRVANKELETFFRSRGDQLATILSVSQTELVQDLSANGTLVEIEKAAGAKCERCWIYKKDIGAQAQWPDICGRCADAVQEWEKLCVV